MGFRVWGVRFGVQGLEFRVEDENKKSEMKKAVDNNMEGLGPLKGVYRDCIGFRDSPQ